jgi:hypothetical protein
VQPISTLLPSPAPAAELHPLPHRTAQWTQPKQLTAAIRSAASVVQLASIVRDHEALLNPIHVAAIATRLPKLSSVASASAISLGEAAAAGSVDHGRASDPWAGIVRVHVRDSSAGVAAEIRRLVRCVLSRIADHGADRYCPRGIASVLWAMARLRARPSPRLLSALLASFCNQLPSAVPQDVSNVLWALAKGVRDEVSRGNPGGSRAQAGTPPAWQTRGPSSEHVSGGESRPAATAVVSRSQVEQMLACLVCGRQSAGASPQTYANSLWAIMILQQHHGWCMCQSLPHLRQATEAFFEMTHHATSVARAALPGHVQPVVRCLAQLSAACAPHAPREWLGWQAPVLRIALEHVCGAVGALASHHATSVLHDALSITGLHRHLLKDGEKALGCFGARQLHEGPGSAVIDDETGAGGNIGAAGAMLDSDNGGDSLAGAGACASVGIGGRGSTGGVDNLAGLHALLADAAAEPRAGPTVATVADLHAAAPEIATSGRFSRGTATDAVAVSSSSAVASAVAVETTAASVAGVAGSQAVRYHRIADALDPELRALGLLAPVRRLLTLVLLMAQTEAGLAQGSQMMVAQAETSPTITPNVALGGVIASAAGLSLVTGPFVGLGYSGAYLPSLSQLLHAQSPSVSHGPALPRGQATQQAGPPHPGILWRQQMSQRQQQPQPQPQQRQQRWHQWQQLQQQQWLRDQQCRRDEGGQSLYHHQSARSRGQEQPQLLNNFSMATNVPGMDHANGDQGCVPGAEAGGLPEQPGSAPDVGGGNINSGLALSLRLRMLELAIQHQAMQPHPRHPQK